MLHFSPTGDFSRIESFARTRDLVSTGGRALLVATIAFVVSLLVVSSSAGQSVTVTDAGNDSTDVILVGFLTEKDHQRFRTPVSQEQKRLFFALRYTCRVLKRKTEPEKVWHRCGKDDLKALYDKGYLPD